MTSLDGGMLGWSEGETCGRKRCKGTICERPVENCSCHINPPCGACTSPREYCPECGWESSEEDWPQYRMAAPGIAEMLTKPTPLDRTKISWRSFPHSNSSMLKKGVYPEGTTSAEVEAKVRGTFGGRFTRFGNGEFEYVAYTDQEEAMTQIDALEVIARALCVDDDVDPDAVDYDRTGAARPNWHCVQGTADAILTALEAKGLVIVPVEPTDELLMSMAVRYDHGLGVPGYYDQPIFKQLQGENHIPHSRRLETALRQMRQIHEEVVGKGFYSPENADRYHAMLSAMRE